MEQRPTGGGSPKAWLRPRTLSVLASRSKQVEGQWLGHCLDLDIVTQGNSAQHVLYMVTEAVTMAIEHDLNHGRDTFDGESWLPAPAEYWSEFRRVVKCGEPAAPGILDRTDEPFDVLAAAVSMVFHRVGQSESSAFSEDAGPCMISVARSDNDNQLSCA